MLRALLEDRFKLRTHTETRQQQIYALVKARSDGRLGPGLHESAVDCLALAPQRELRDGIGGAGAATSEQQPAIPLPACRMPKTSTG
jgi:uncharacterized protein (TIGR03435 family)